jgi:hypothetical protein
MGRAETPNRWWDSRCSWRHSARGCRCAPLVTGATPPSAADLPRRAAALVAAQFDTVAAAAEGRDAPVATGVMPAGVWR